MNVGKIRNINFTAAAEFIEYGIPIETLQQILTNNGIENDKFDKTFDFGMVSPRGWNDPIFLATEDELEICKQSRKKGRLIKPIKLPKNPYILSDVLKAIENNTFDLRKLRYKNVFKRLFHFLTRKINNGTSKNINALKLDKTRKLIIF